MKVKGKGRHWLRNRIILVLGCFSVLFIMWIRSLNEYVEPRLQAIAKQNVIFAINNITQSVLADLEYDPDTHSNDHLTRWLNRIDCI